MPKSYAVGLQPLPTADKEAFFCECRRACADMDDAELKAWASGLDTKHKLWLIQWYHADIEMGVPQVLLAIEAMFYSWTRPNGE